MKKTLLITTLLVLTGSFCRGQADMVILKKRNKTVDRYYIGSYIYFETGKDQRWSGKIYKLKADTIFIVPIEERVYMHSWGLVLTDTIQLNRIGIALNTISNITKRDENLVFVKNGTLLQLLGGGYALLNIINTATSQDKEPVFGSKNLKNLGIAAGVFGIGTMQRLLYKDYYPLGKKYKLKILMLTPDTLKKDGDD